MAMTRQDFEQAVFLTEGSELRRALMMHTLKNSMEWKSWSDIGANVAIPYPPNDVIFACLYSVYKKKPSAGMFLQLSFMLMPRNKKEAGYMVDPVHKDSAARMAARMKVAKVATDRGLGADDLLKQVYSEMWLPGASLKTWAAYQMFTVNEMRMNLDTNVADIAKDGAKKIYFETLRNKFCGGGIATGSLNKDNTGAFDEKAVGMNVLWGRKRG
jgi:hypothetical protein